MILQHLLAAILLIIIQQFWHHFWQAFCMHKSSVITFQTQSFFIFCWLSIILSQLRITTYHLHYLLIIDLRPACWSLPRSWVIFHFLAPFSELLRSNNIYLWYGVRFKDLKHFKCMWQSFLQTGMEFRNFSFLGVHCLILTVDSWTNWIRENVNKIMWKKGTGCKKLMLLVNTP